MDYPDQIDCVWLAADPIGRLAAMITAGEGPIPAWVLTHDFDVTDVEKALLDLSVIGEARMAVKVPDPSSFLALSLRGLFVYDWTDLHRTRAEIKRAYELVSSPTVHISLEALPVGLRNIVSDVGAFFGSAFLSIS